MTPQISDALKNTVAPGQLNLSGWSGVQIPGTLCNTQFMTPMFMNALELA